MTDPEQPEQPDTDALNLGPPRSPAGRRSLLNDHRQQVVIDAVRAGNYLKIAAQWAGISESTLTKWLARGRAAEAVDKAGGQVDEVELPYLTFLREVTRAETSAEVAAVTAWRGAFKDDWRAARDWLTFSRARDRWGPVTRVTMSTEEAERRIDAAVEEALRVAGVEDTSPPPYDEQSDLDELLDGLGDEPAP